MWPMKVEHEEKLDRTEISMITYICGFTLKQIRKVQRSQYC